MLVFKKVILIIRVWVCIWGCGGVYVGGAHEREGACACGCVYVSAVPVDAGKGVGSP